MLRLVYTGVTEATQFKYDFTFENLPKIQTIPMAKAAYTIDLITLIRIFILSSIIQKINATTKSNQLKTLGRYRKSYLHRQLKSFTGVLNKQSKAGATETYQF